MAIVFEATAVATFDNLSGGNFQRIFDLSNGPGTDSIWLGNVSTTSTLRFEVEQDGVRHTLSAPGAITEGAETEWRVTIDDTGTFTIFEDGVQIATQNLGLSAIPNDVPRTESLIGDSPHAADDPLIGTVDSLDVETTLSNGFDMTFGDTVNVTESFDGTSQAETLDASTKTAAIAIDGGDGADAISGGQGNDILYGGEGSDTLSGGAGNDTIYGGESPATSVGGTNTVSTNFHVIFLGNRPDIDTSESTHGNENPNGLIGTYGGAGDELFSKVQEAVVFDNDGDKKIDFDHMDSSESVVIDGVSKTADTGVVYNATVNFTDGSSGGFTAVVMQTTDGNTYLMPEFSDNADNSLLTSKPIESISLDSVLEGYVNIYANRVDADYALPGDTDASDDVLEGGAGADYLDGGAGNDRLDGGSGNDTVIGGTGSDTIQLNDGFLGADISGGEDLDGGDIDVLDASGITTAGVNVVLSGSEAGQVTSGGNTANFVKIESFKLTDQADSFNGFNASSDMTVDGGGGDDTIRGGNADNNLSGGTGDDLFEVGYGIDDIDGGDGTDTLSIDAADDVITLTFDGTGSGSFNDDDGDSGTFSSIEAVQGSAGGDSIDASLDGGGVNLLGEAGNDTLLGGSGSDTIDGGTGTDVLTGGAGPDVFVVDGSADTITDFDATTGVDGGGTDDNDFVDLSGYYDAANLAAFNAANGTNYKSALQWMKADQTDDGILQGAGGLRLENGGSAVAASEMNAENTGVVCFAQGTLIATNRGEIAVEDLRKGDLVQTMDNGFQPIRWIGKRAVSQEEMVKSPSLRPIRLNKRAFGINGTGDDLVVSPQHRILLVSKVAARMFGTKEVLMCAKRLLKIPGVAEIADVKEVCYFHILFDNHEIIFANSIPAESLYLGTKAMMSLTPEGRCEIEKLFPAIAQQKTPVGKCRPFVEGKRAKRLASRLIKNEKQLAE